MMTDMKAAGALGAKTARACDSCVRRRARWFCAADDAFLCHGCDTLVHSANQLASRHERVRLQTASSKVTTWHSGFTRKARTPRHNNNKHFALQQRLKDQVLFNNASVLPVVPELGGVDNDEIEEEQLLCRVPVFDPFDAEPSSAYGMKENDMESFSDRFDMDFVEFAADVESLLTGVDEDSINYKLEENEVGGGGKSAMVRVEDEEELDDDIACHVESVLDMTNEDVFRWNNIDSVLSGAREEKESVVVDNVGVSEEVGTKRDIFLRLNYDEVITAWASQGSSPWKSAINSDYDLCLGSSGENGEVIRSLRGHLDGGREARVSRYREKRRTRLFAKKISSMCIKNKTGGSELER
ncbi:zinc finger protein CONSTANS-LIKE 16-like isoform X2 [Abrus precatorius]|uniref:Zinc finger protein CONSTANS-LIKE 16-like isoform X2 n=1 Tax=Abrus precatorius TaxID=3816 RepID=A0A8B8KEC4_ABRPR|nr:zinc finger protein CONSTANS-LIKE 16-like isoform X2 [Abrus precatorius]